MAEETKMKNQWAIAIRTTIVTLVLTGVLYPCFVTGLAQMLFPARANGTLAADKDGKAIGSEIIAQPFMNPAYLQPRPSAAGEKGWDGTSSGGSNLAVTSKKLQERVAADVKRLKEENPDQPAPIPAELVTASGSGLDPHLSPAGALWQAPRIAKARRASPDKIAAIINAAVEDRTLGFIGEPRVNTIRVNLELDRQFGRPIPVPGQDRKEEKKEDKTA
ncbi:MAG TPA: potassium-transporting ATPase subunit KdpC [Candidatus Binatia bacterium]|jgi:K+-transporting ATPase ATPase C chain